MVHRRIYQPESWIDRSEIVDDDGFYPYRGYHTDSGRTNYTFNDNYGRVCYVTCRPRYPRSLPRGCPPGSRELFNYIIGRSVEEARYIVGLYGYLLRIVVADGRRLIVTQDYRESRINVSVRNNIVEAVLYCG